jgi:isopentenyl-diphosphate delta-isomerase
MGFAAPLKKVFDFIYRAPFANGLTEYEFDHVFVGYYDGKVEPDQREVSNHAFWSMEKIASQIQSHPELFTVWFPIAFAKLTEWWKENAKE